MNTNISLVIARANHLIIAFLFMFAFCSHAFSQDTTYSEEITIIAPYTPSVTIWQKLSIIPKIVTSDIEKPEFTYSIDPIQTPIDYHPSELSPVKIVGEPLPKIYRNYIKGGFGNYRTPYIEFFANSVRSRKHAFGVHAKHFSSGDMKDYPNSSNSINELNTSATRYTKYHSLSGSLDFERKVVHYYGYADSISENFDLDKKDDYKQRYYDLGAVFSYKSHFIDDDKVNHSLKGSYNLFLDYREVQEHHVAFGADLDKEFNLISATDSDKFGFDAKVKYIRSSDSLRTMNATLLDLFPFFETTFDEYSVLFGLKGTIRFDSVTDFYLFPVAEANIMIVENTLKAFIGIGGEIKRNSYRDLSHINPYLASAIPLDYTTQKFEIYGGLNSRIGRNLDFVLSLDGSSLGNQPFFVNDTSTKQNKELFNQFTVVYDDVKLIHGKAEFIYQNGEKYRIVLAGDFFRYTLDKEIEAWHKPQYSVSLQTKYNLGNKFILTGGVKIIGKSYAKIFENNDVVKKELKGYADINAGINYLYSKKLSFFASFHNIANTRYFRWNNYASQKFNFMGGLSYSF